MTGAEKPAKYHRRRDFGKTAEPQGGAVGGTADGAPSYVVQIHDARSMQFDFRLEADGVLKSFAPPSPAPLAHPGPPTSHRPDRGGRTGEAGKTP